MSLPKQLDRIRRMHYLIERRRTGTPRRFAEQLGVSPSLLYQLIAELKKMGAPVHYCSLRQSYEYYERTELRLGFFPRELPVEELHAVSGGARVVALLGKNFRKGEI